MEEVTLGMNEKFNFRIYISFFCIKNKKKLMEKDF